MRSIQGQTDDRRLSTVASSQEVELQTTQERRFRALIDGVLEEWADDEIKSTSPIDGSVVGRVPAAGAADVDRAVNAARAAHDSGVWRRMSPRGRGLRMRHLASLIEQAAPELAELEARDTGKAVAYTRANDLQIAVEALDYMSTQFRPGYSRSRAVLAPDHVHHELVQPIGVVAEILPWNGPIWTGVQRIAAILAAGCTAVIKPSELGSMTIGRIAELIVEADIPAGVINVIFGSGSVVGSHLVAHRGVDAVSFTGGTDTGGRILRALAADIKPITLELGGKNALIVLDDADIDEAALWASIGGFANAGQVCVASSRVLVADALHDRFVDALARHAQSIVVGDPLDPNTQIGSLINTAHAASVREAIALGAQTGTVVTPRDNAEGCFIRPTVISDLPEQDPLLRNEIFGPVVTVERFADDFDAVRRANNTEYGLSAGVFTSDVRRAWEMSAALRAGEVYVNRWFSPGVLDAPVAGQKQSGFGESGIDAYLRSTSVFFDRANDLSVTSSH